MSTKHLQYISVQQKTRTGSASFPNSVVFPGGVTEAADESTAWLQLLQSYGYSSKDFDALHSTNSSPIFQPDPVKRHVSLRITAIRETFEELGLLLCSREHKKDKVSGANIITDVDVQHWQNKVNKNPEELLNLCKELKCYPDIWSLHYWSNWLTPAPIPKRFDTAFFVAALGNEIPQITSNTTEVKAVKWANPQDILEKNIRKEHVLHPPQIYELNRLLHHSDIATLIEYASERSSNDSELMYPIVFETKDGKVHVLAGDDLYPLNVNYNEELSKLYSDKTVLELRESCHKLHRLEVTHTHGYKTEYVFRGLNPTNHINMGDKIISANIAVHKTVK